MQSVTVTASQRALWDRLNAEKHPSGSRAARVRPRHRQSAVPRLSYIKVAMKKVFLACALILLSSAAAFAQAITPPCVIDTSAQRAVWDRMKADNHVLYQQIKFNTTWDRYADHGRWELVAALIDNDTVLFRKAVVETLANLPVSPVAGNWIREFGLERVMQYGCLYPHMTADERSRYRTWIENEAETILKGTRSGDSDQATGNYFTLAMADTVLGTTYLSRTFVDGFGGPSKPVGGLTATTCDRTRTTMRDAVCWYVQVLAEGGQWMEAAARYDLGTVQLLLMGANWTGIEHFPEVAQFVKDFARWLPHFLTPNLKDAFQSGDNEHPHSLSINVALSDLLSFVAGFVGDADIASRLRELEADVYAANGLNGPTPLYARYFYKADPFAPKLPWKAWAGLSFVARGQGHVYWRTGFEPTDRGTHVHCPTFSKGIVDHFQAFPLGDFRHFRKGRFTQDRPLGYAPNIAFGNTVLIGARVHPGLEATGLAGTGFMPGKVGFVSCITAGLSGLTLTDGGWGRIPSFIHEGGRDVFEDLSGDASVLAVFDRVQADDPRTQTLDGGKITWQGIYAPQQRDLINAVPKVVELRFHTPVSPTFSADRKTFSWSVGPSTASIQQVWPAAPLDNVVVDETKQNACKNVPGALDQSCFGGHMSAGELKFAVVRTQPTHAPWTIYAHCVSAREETLSVTAEWLGSRTCEAFESTEGDPVVGVRVVREGRDVVFLISAKQGPRIESTYTKNIWGSTLTSFDRTKFDRVVAARRLTDVRLTIDGDADLYLADLDPSVSTVTLNGTATTVTREGDLALLSTGVVPPPTDTAQDLIKQIQDALTKLSELIK